MALLLSLQAEAQQLRSQTLPDIYVVHSSAGTGPEGSLHSEMAASGPPVHANGAIPPAAITAGQQVGQQPELVPMTSSSNYTASLSQLGSAAASKSTSPAKSRPATTSASGSGLLVDNAWGSTASMPVNASANDNSSSTTPPEAVSQLAAAPSTGATPPGGEQLQPCAVVPATATSRHTTHSTTNPSPSQPANSTDSQTSMLQTQVRLLKEQRQQRQRQQGSTGSGDGQGGSSGPVLPATPANAGGRRPVAPVIAGTSTWAEEEEEGGRTHGEAQTWLIQEFCDGGTLQDYVQSGKVVHPDGTPDMVSTSAPQQVVHVSSSITACKLCNNR